ncbi:unnamed protein product [Heligmosomoides polygyrus]|uniref:Nuclear receptor domain-containing protein n=1 Tax=Heligmosomoides polygyrus TaxID=6339 RepID=A0A183FLQ5_HELPZ|nr:unnamed protein product [Heligmosomoides polygyrus]
MGPFRSVEAVRTRSHIVGFFAPQTAREAPIFPAFWSFQFPSDVCHSTLANGLHFGARTCAACAAFFRRTISDGKKYVCKRSQRCNNPTKDATGYRKICRSCRLKRCMDIGMLPDNVQHKRCRRDSPPPAVPRVFNTMLQPFYNQIPNNGVSNISSISHRL